MKAIIRKILYWFFKKRVKVYGNHLYVSDQEMLAGDSKRIEALKREIVQEIAQKMVEDGIFEFKVENSLRFGGRTISARIYVVK